MFMKWIDISISITNSIRINYIYGLTAANYQTTELLDIRINTKKANAKICICLKFTCLQFTKICKLRPALKFQCNT